MEELAIRIHDARKLAGLTQGEAAEKVGTTGRTWQRWEGGEVGGALRHLDAIAQALGTTREGLLAREGETGEEERLETLEARVADLTATVERLTRLLTAREELDRAAAELLRETPRG